jgi:hypothetical protein
MSSSFASSLPPWLLATLGKLSLALPSRPPQTMTSRYDAVFTVLLFIALLYMTVGSILNHVKEGVTLENAAKETVYLGRDKKDGKKRYRMRRGEPIPFAKQALRYYQGFTLIVAAAMFITDAGSYMLWAVNGGGGAGAGEGAVAPPRGGKGAAMPAPRLVTFWMFNFLFLYCDVCLTAASAVRPIARLTALTFGGVAKILLIDRGPLAVAVQAVGELHAGEMIVTRVAMLGATYVLAQYAR